MLKKLFAFPVVRYGAIAVLTLSLLMAIPTTRALAGELLNLFRVQQVAVLPIDTAGLENMTGNEALGSQLSALYGMPEKLKSVGTLGQKMKGRCHRRSHSNFS